MAIDLEELRHKVRHMTSRQGIYHVLKDELTKQERWRNPSRGVSFKVGKDDRRKEWWKDEKYHQ